MALGIMTTRGFVEAMQAEGIPVPEHCRQARLVMAYDSAVCIQFDVMVTHDYLDKLGKALVRMADARTP